MKHSNIFLKKIKKTFKDKMKEFYQIISYKLIHSKLSLNSQIN